MKPATAQQKKSNRFERMTAAEFLRRSSEADIQKGITDLLRVCGLPYSVTDASLTFDDRGKVAGRAVTTDGWPDVTACLPAGRFLGIETKTADGKLRPAQIKVHAHITDQGGAVIIPRSVSDFARQMIGLGFNHPALLSVAGKKGEL